VKVDKEGHRLPRNYPEKLKSDWAKMTGGISTE